MVFHFPQRKINLNLNLQVLDTVVERKNEFDFPGLLLDDKLSWKAHIDKIANKLSIIVGILKIRSFLPSKGLLLMYNSLFLPHLNYAILAWGYSCDRIVKLQKQAIRLICSARFNAHTEPLFKKLNTLKLYDLMQARALNFFYRYSNNELPRYFDQMFSTTYATHPYPTRNRNAPQRAMPNRSLTKKTTRFYVPSVLDNTPSIVTEKVNTHSYSGFSKYVKNYLIGQYSESCNITDCHVCNSQ